MRVGLAWLTTCGGRLDQGQRTRRTRVSNLATASHPPSLSLSLSLFLLCALPISGRFLVWLDQGQRTRRTRVSDLIIASHPPFLSLCLFFFHVCCPSHDIFWSDGPGAEDQEDKGLKSCHCEPPSFSLSLSHCLSCVLPISGRFLVSGFFITFAPNSLK